MKHTKGKLEARLSFDKKKWLVCIGQGAGSLIADCHKSKEAKVNAERLVKCWNSHDALLAACEAALEFIGRSNKTDWENEITPILEQAIAAAHVAP